MKYIITENQLKKIIKQVINEQDPPSSDTLFGGKPVLLPGNNSHAGQSGWPSGNAWDIMTGIGTPVYSLYDGTLATWSDYGPNIKYINKKTNRPCSKSEIKNKQCKKLFGQSFTVNSSDGKPDIYYTHLMNTTVKKGDKITCGQLLGYVMDFPTSDSDHVHIGVEWGHNIKEFLDDNGKIKCVSSKINVMPKFSGTSFQAPKDKTNVVHYYKKL